MWTSDHRPIKIIFAQEVDSLGKERFYFDKWMLKKKANEEVIKRSWYEL